MNDEFSATLTTFVEPWCNINVFTKAQISLFIFTTIERDSRLSWVLLRVLTLTESCTVRGGFNLLLKGGFEVLRGQDADFHI